MPITPVDVHLLLPGLYCLREIGDSFIQPLRTLRLPALQRLARAASCRYTAETHPETLLLTLFGLPPQTAPAPYRRQGEAAVTKEAWHGLCADPVYVHLLRKNALLNTLPAQTLTLEEAQTFATVLTQHFAPDEPDFVQVEVSTPQRWYIRTARADHTCFEFPDDQLGSPLRPLSVHGDKARQWQRFISEVQMLLHNHPLNTQRLARGEMPVNSLWLWGGGEAAPVPPTMPAAQVMAEDVLTRGLTAAAGGIAQPLSIDNVTRNTLIVLDPLRQPMLQRDNNAWLAALQQLEQQWFQPLLTRLHRGHWRSLRISAPGDGGMAVLDIRRRDLLLRWGRASLPLFYRSE